MISIIEAGYERELAELRLQVHLLSERNKSLVADNMARQNERVELVQKIARLEQLLNDVNGHKDQQGEPQ